METQVSQKTSIFKRWWFWVLMGGLGLALVVSGGGTGSGQTTNTPPNTGSLAESSQQDACATPLKTLKAKSISVDYKKLEKDPESYLGKTTTFTGQVLQVQQNGNDGIIRLSVTNEGYGYWSPNDVVYVTYHQPTSAVNDDIVTVTGTLTGTQTYTSEANYQITIPSLDACGNYIQLANDTGSTLPAPANTNGKQSTSESGTWHVVYEDARNVGTQTPSITLKGSQQRISYSCSILDASNSSGSNFEGLIKSPQSLGLDQFANYVDCPVSNVSYEHALLPGEYYLVLGSENASYQVTVEDYY